jgi:hypothetical protein
MLLSRSIGIIIVILSLNAAAQVMGDCKARVRVEGVSLEGNNVKVAVRVEATGKTTLREVYYYIDGQYRFRFGTGSTVPGMIYHQSSTVVEQGDEYSNDVVEIYVGSGGTPLEEGLRIRKVDVSACYTK